MGKPEVGKVRVSARREASSIVIEVSDDGRGMSPDAMRRSAVSKGVIDPEAAAALTDAESLDSSSGPDSPPPRPFPSSPDEAWAWTSFGPAWHASAAR